MQIHQKFYWKIQNCHHIDTKLFYNDHAFQKKAFLIISQKDKKCIKLSGNLRQMMIWAG